MTTKTPPWVKSLRSVLRDDNGSGWGVRDIRGKLQLTVRFDDGTRSAVVTDLPWERGSTTPVLTLAGRLKPLLAQGKTLSAAYGMLRGPSMTSTGDTDWAVVADAFKNHKISTGLVGERTYHRNYRLRIERALVLLQSKPTPRSATALLKLLIDKHFPDGRSAGTTDRRLAVQYTVQFLDYAVKECGASERWTPPADKSGFIGIRSKAKVATTPAKDDQIVRLLAGISDPKWHTAVGLVACFGLRGVELSEISVSGGLLHCSYRKRTARRPEGTPERDIVGLDPAGLEGLSASLLAILSERGKDALPAGCNTERAGDALHQHLEQNRTWQKLVAETAEVPRSDGGGQSLVPYSLRHGFALRAHELYEISPRRAAALMGHSLQTHSSTYGAWTDKEMIQSTLVDVQQQVDRRKLENCLVK